MYQNSIEYVYFVLKNNSEYDKTILKNLLKKDFEEQNISKGSQIDFLTQVMVSINSKIYPEIEEKEKLIDETVNEIIVKRKEQIKLDKKLKGGKN